MDQIPSNYCCRGLDCIYFTPRVPSQPEISLALSEQPEARSIVSGCTSASFGEYSKLELALKFTNPASRALWLASPLIVASGIRTRQRHGQASTNLRPYKFIRGNDEKRIDSINRFAITHEPFMLRIVPIESSLPAGSSRTISIIVPTPRGKYQGVEISLFMPCANKYISGVDPAISVNENGWPMFGICSQKKGGNDCPLMSQREKEESGTETSVQRIQVWLK